MNHKAEILKTRFTKSIINSKVSHINVTILLKKKKKQQKKAGDVFIKTVMNRLDNNVFFFLFTDLYFLRIRKLCLNPKNKENT